MKIVIFGLSVTSTWGNGHGTTYRALLRALHERGHAITFFEKDVKWYALNRDLPNPDFCQVRLYKHWREILPQVRAELNEADVAMVGSYFPDGIAAIDEMLDAKAAVKAFYDIDTPVTISALRQREESDYIARRQIPQLDLYLSFTGGPMLREIEREFGAVRTAPLYCSVDPQQYYQRRVNHDFACDLSYMGTYAPDRQPKLEEFLCEPARRRPDRKFIVAGPQYPETQRWPENVRRIPHLNGRWHPELYSSSRLTLNITRRDMTIAGYSPSVRLFEAAACKATIASDNWPGLEEFFTPEKEILLPVGSDDVMRYVTELSADELRRVGEQAQARVLAEHANTRRAMEFERAAEAAFSIPQLAANNP